MITIWSEHLRVAEKFIVKYGLNFIAKSSSQLTTEQPWKSQTIETKNHINSVATSGDCTRILSNLWFSNNTKKKRFQCQFEERAVQKREKRWRTKIQSLSTRCFWKILSRTNTARRMWKLRPTRWNSRAKTATYSLVQQSIVFSSSIHHPRPRRKSSVLSQRSSRQRVSFPMSSSLAEISRKRFKFIKLFCRHSRMFWRRLARKLISHPSIELQQLAKQCNSSGY